MKRFLFAILWLTPLLAWLLFAYLDPQRAFLPTISYPQGQLTQWLRLAGVVAAVLFVGIQLGLAGSTMYFIRRAADQSQPSPLNLHVGWELVWTVLPIALTLAVILRSFPTWRGM